MAKFQFLIDKYLNYQKSSKSNKEEEKKIIISMIIPIFFPRLSWLKKCIKSVIFQEYTGWELILVPDGPQPIPVDQFLTRMNNPKIKILDGLEHEGVSKTCNRGLQYASGNYIGFLDQDDLLTKDALTQITDIIKKHNPDIIYSDEDIFRDTIIGRRCILPHFKPDFSPDLLLSHNYITHIMVIRHDLIKRNGGFRPEYDGAQDYDLILRLTEKAENICHIRKILYHWRYHSSSTSHDNTSRPQCHDAGKRALEETLIRRNIKGKVEETDLFNHYRVHREIIGNPKVSIIIPFKDQPELLDSCLQSITNLTTWKEYEIIGVSNNSIEPETSLMQQKWNGLNPKVTFYSDNNPFNYSSLNNSAAYHATGEYLILLNNDIEIITPNWIESLLEHAQRPEIGSVGGLLYYPDGTLQHAGIAVGIRGFAGRPHRRAPGNSTGYFHRNVLTRNVSAITGALMMVKKSKFFEVGGLDEKNLPVSLNDVDFCLRLLEIGYSNVFTPYCKAIHAESVSRGFEDNCEKKSRFQREISYFQSRHEKILQQGDPYLNPNISRTSENMSIHINNGEFPSAGCSKITYN